jgi:hypothetical protein
VIGKVLEMASNGKVEGTCEWRKHVNVLWRLQLKNYGFSVRILSCVCGTFFMIFGGVEGRKIGRLLLFRTSSKNGKLK